MEKQTSYKTILVSTLALMFSGLVSFFYTFFSQVFPTTQTKIQVLESRSKGWDETRTILVNEVKEIKTQQHEIYLLILDKKATKK